MIQVAFYKANQPKATWLDKLISFYTKGPFSHVELIIDGYQYSSSPRDGGVRKVPHKLDHTVWEYIELNNIETNKILTFFEETKYAKYDYTGILGFIFLNKDSEKKWFCSEWVTRALIIGGYNKLFPIKESITSPNRLYRLIKG